MDVLIPILLLIAFLGVLLLLSARLRRTEAASQRGAGAPLPPRPERDARPPAVRRRPLSGRFGV
jgi:hypothetical protein